MALAIAVLGVASGSAADPQAATPITTAQLGGADRFLSYVSTDKPIYRPNEKMYVRAIVLNAANHQPLPAGHEAMASIKILGPKGETVASGNVQSIDSVAGFNWTVPEGAGGGEYTLKVNYPWQGYAPAERKFDVRVYRAPRLRSQIVFVRDGYGPGDKVAATLHTERAEGGIPANAKVTLIARVDDREIYTGPGSVDATGNCTAAFDLPKAMERGEGTLAFVIQDGGTVETASKTIPILLQTVDLQIYPEGGDAVAGVDNRFYIEAKTPAQKPADLVGSIVDSHGKKVADVKTEHEGRGRFDFTPVKGESYWLTLSQPAGISKTWKLPDAKATGVALRTLDDVVAKDQPVRVQVIGAGSPEKYKITLTRREVDVAESQNVVTREAGVDEYVIKAREGVDGVLTVTAWNSKGQPVAERLIYRQPAHSVQVTVTPEKSTYTPGGKAGLNIVTTDENGRPISAVVGLTVTDDSVLEMVDKREQAPRLPAMVMLEPEVRELADAHVYLDPANPKAALATDLLLGTQGWRRFAFVKTAEFLDKYGEQGRRVLADVRPAPPVPAAAVFALGGVVDEARFKALDGEFAGAEGGAVNRALTVDHLQLEAETAIAAPVAAPQLVDKAKEEQQAKAPQGEEMQDKKDALQVAAAQPAAPAADADIAIGGLAPAMPPKDELEMPFVAKQRLMRIRPNFGPGGLTIVRQYAHDLRPGWTPASRADFSETLYWSAAIKTDKNGRGTAAFSMADSVTTYRIVADSFADNGSLGASTNTVQAVQPFYIEPKMPLEVTAGDVIELPVSAINNSPETLEKFALTVNDADGLSIEAPKDAPTALTAGQRVREVYKITVGDKVGDVKLTVSAAAGAFSDKVTRVLRIKPKGFPTQIAYGGLLDQSKTVSKTFTIPASIVPNSMVATISVYPSPVANMTDAVAGLLQEPNGCFEQTSSTNYPLAMAQEYFTTHQGVDAALVARAADLLGRGYQRLVGFECKDKGYEWFGGDAPGHEALTAYGLMEFADMKQAKLSTVDDQMVGRTRAWLLGREDGKGGFQRNAKSCDSFGSAPEETTNAYIVWALLRSGETAKSLDKEIAAVRDAATKTDDSYVVALAANICEMAGDDSSAKPLLDKLAKKQNAAGGVDGAVTSITRSGGDALAIETTALATQAWLADPTFAAAAQSSIKFLADNCKGGRFGSTQSTILALRAITDYDVKMAHPRAAGQVTLLVDNKPVGDPIAFTADTKEPLKFSDFAAGLTPGTHTLALQMTDGSQMPFSMAVTYNSITPSSAKECTLDLSTTLKDTTIAEGGITEERVVVTNTSDDPAPSPMAIVGIPGGLEVRHDQLKELVKSGKVDAYEVRGREVILYWRQFKPHTTADFPLSLTAAVPGTYTAPASRAYKYYTDELKQWKEGATVSITAKGSDAH
jgi:hypothetical protein